MPAPTPKELPGFKSWEGGEPFEENAGPFFAKDNVAAFVCAENHLNGNGVLHGGMLMAFADYALFVIADNPDDIPSVTISCATEFLRGAAPIGQPVYADGEVMRQSKHIVFVRGRIFTDDEPMLASFNGILKRLPDAVPR